MMYIFGGLPGTGKSTLAVAIARAQNAFYLRVDTIEQAIKTAGTCKVETEGYEVAYALALENLRLGAKVVADSVNALPVTRKGWRSLAEQSKTSFVEIEVICSDADEHRRRVEERRTTVPGLQLPTWEQVLSREYVPWAGDHVVIDTAGETMRHSILKLLTTLDLDNTSS